MPWSPGVESPIVVMNPDGSNKKKIPGSQANYGLAWSPDGRKVVFEWGCDIYIMNVDGSRGPQKLTNDPDDCALTPDWSPDGSRIAFTRSGDIYKVAVRSSRVRRLTRTPDYETWPTWSPDGSKIAYTKWATPAESEAYSAIYKMHADGSDPTPVVDVPGRNERIGKS